MTRDWLLLLAAKLLPFRTMDLAQAICFYLHRLSPFVEVGWEDSYKNT